MATELEAALRVLAREVRAGSKLGRSGVKEMRQMVLTNVSVGMGGRIWWS